MINTRQFRILVWLVLVLLVLNVSALITIMWMRHNPPPLQMHDTECPKIHGKHLFKKHDALMQEEAGLNDAQMKAIRALRKTHFAEIRQINAEIRQTREYQFEQLRQGNPGQAQIDSISARIGALHQQWSLSSAQFLTGIGNLCTPDQREKVFDALKKSRKHHQMPDEKTWHHEGSRKQPCSDSSGLQ